MLGSASTIVSSAGPVKKTRERLLGQHRGRVRVRVGVRARVRVRVRVGARARVRVRVRVTRPGGRRFR